MNHLVASWLKRGIVLGGLAFIGFCGSHLRAQDEEAAIAQSPDDAAKLFISILSSGERATGPFAIESVVSRRQFERAALESPALYDQLMVRMLLKAESWKWDAQATAQGDRTVVQLQPVQAAPPPVVCVREAGGWKVDVWETAQRWLGKNDPLIKQINVALTAEPSQEPNPTRLCQSNLKQVGLGMMMYAQDYDEVFPPANKWSDVLKPYIKNERIFHCPATAKSGGKPTYGYAMNWKLSRQSLAVVESPATTVLDYESNILARNQNGDGRDLMYRHTQNNQDGAVYAFVDGHVAWRSRQQVQNFRLKPQPARLSKYFEVPNVAR
jgi:prepilin-type processing-associated H-X9-DG protein